MKPGSFILNGVHSEDIRTVIQGRPTLATPRRRVTFKQGVEQDGALPFDEESYDNTEIELSLFTQGDDASENRERIYHLFNSGKYMDLILYSDPTKVYKVMTIEFPNFESRYFMGESISYQVKLTALPYKHLVLSPLTTLATPSTLVNPSLYPSEPRIAIVGSGNITLTIGGRDFIMKGVDGYIIVDSNLEIAYKDLALGVNYDLENNPSKPEDVINQNSKVFTRVYPTFSPGVNSVTWVGNVTRVDILPKWRTLA